jgi:hypothetical protein
MSSVIVLHEGFLCAFDRVVIKIPPIRHKPESQQLQNIPANRLVKGDIIAHDFIQQLLNRSYLKSIFWPVRREDGK